MKNVKPKEQKTMAEQLEEAQVKMKSIRTGLADERFVKPDEVSPDTQRADQELAEKIANAVPPEITLEQAQEVHEVRLEQAQAEVEKTKAEVNSVRAQAWTGYAIAALTGVAAVAVGYFLVKGSKPLPETRV